MQNLGIRRYVIFGTISLALLMSAMSMTAVIVALPEIATGLNTPLIWVGWIITSFQLAQSVAMPLSGRLSEQFGQKRVFIIAAAIFGLSALGAGLSSNIAMLIILRVIMAAGGGAFMPSAAGIVSELFPRHRAQAIGLFGSIFPIGGILGPNLGGFLVHQFSWRWAFLMNVPVAGAVVVLAWLLIPQARHDAKQHLDILGAMLFVSGILSFMLGLTLLGADYGLPLAAIWGLLVLSVVLLLIFWRHEVRTVQPIIDVEILQMRPFIASNIYNILFGVTVFGLFSFMPLFAVTEYGFNTLMSGVVLTGRSIAMIVVSAVTSLFLLRRVGYHPLLIGGLLLVAGSVFALSTGAKDVSLLGLPISNFWLLTGMLALGGTGMGFANPAANNAGMELLPSKVSSIIGLRGMFRSLGGVLSTTIIFFFLAGYADKGQGLREIFLILSFLTLLAIPIVFMMPTGREKPLTRKVAPSPTVMT